MALVINDRVKETSTTTGTGTFSLAGAATGFDTFVAGIATGNTTYYAIFNQGTTEWEVGLGTVTDATPDTLARTTVITSSNSDSAVDFAAGTKDVFCTLPASKTVFGKQEGTNFTDSLLVGHSTTGTLDNALKNTGVGIDCLDSLTTADETTAVGMEAGTAVTSASYCTYMGSKAGRANASGSSNTAIGRFAEYYNVNGSNNTAVGTGALSGATGTTHSNNSALGNNALGVVSTGAYNIAIGKNSGDNLTTGDGNIVIGNVDAASATDDVSLKITGYDGSTTANWIAGDSSANIVIAGTTHSAGGQLTTTGKAFVMGF